MLDTSSDESDDDQPGAIDADFVNMVKTQKPSGIPQKSGIPMRTMVMPKGQLTVDSLDTLLDDEASMPVQSH